MSKTEAEFVIDSVGRRGDGVGYVGGRPAFVPGALPGEVVRARLDADRGEGHPARLLEILKPSPQRVAPPCPYYEQCGGCSLQHWSDDAYKSWTRERVEALLARNDLHPATWGDAVFVPDRTRRRATLAATKDKGVFRFGYHRARSHNVTDIPDCLVLSPRLQTLMNDIRPYIAKLLYDGQAIDVFLQDTGGALDVVITGQIGARRQPQLREQEMMGEISSACGIARISWRLKERDEPEIMMAAAPVLKGAGRLSVPLPPGAFMQPSAAGEDALVAAVRAALTGRATKKIADLFAGCGTFAGPLLEYGAVHAVEGDEAAVKALANAARMVSGLSVEKRNLFTDPLSPLELKNYDAVLFDPPRAGALAQATQLAASKVPVVIGVSCNPATFARDAALLCGGGYTLQSVQLVDQFTWSAHVELVGVFTR